MPGTVSVQGRFRKPRRLLASDSLMRIDPSGGFTAIESRLTQRLKAEMQKAADRQ